MNRLNLKWNIPISEVIFHTDVGMELAIPYIKPSDMLTYLLNNHPEIVMGGFSKQEGAKLFCDFWNVYKRYHGSHPVFQELGQNCHHGQRSARRHHDGRKLMGGKWWVKWDQEMIKYTIYPIDILGEMGEIGVTVDSWVNWWGSIKWMVILWLRNPAPLARWFIPFFTMVIYSSCYVDKTMVALC